MPGGNPTRIEKLVSGSISPVIRPLRVLAAFFAAGLAAIPSVRAAAPDYRLGDVAREDVITSVPLVVVNPEATEALKQKMAQQVQFIIRLTPQSAGEAEQELRETIASARTKFISLLQQALNGRAPNGADLDSPAFAASLRDVARESPKDLPLEKLAPLWIRGDSDDSVVNSLVQPVREVMAQPVVGTKNDSAFPASQLVRIISVKSATEPPTSAEIESAGTAIAPGKIVSLWRARRIVETHFPAGQESLGRFAGSFVRINAYPDPGLTEIARAKRMEGVTVNDTYDAAQVIVHQGQVIDRPALAALTALREKSLIGVLQTKLEEEKSVSGQTTVQAKWITGGLSLACLVLVAALWRRRSPPARAVLTLGTGSVLVGSEQKFLPGPDEEQNWRKRALLAEGKAERAQAAVRSGAMGWMREKFIHALFRQRGQLLSTQQKAEAEMRELELRLQQLHTPLQERIKAYEKRIEDLEKDLASKGEENRELIGARITLAKQQLLAERQLRRFDTN